MINGVINVFKEKGYTSHDVVAVLRGVFKQKKIGHTGTLDPDAEGVLPVCLGKATKLCDMLTDKDKEYETVMLLGVTTDTQDVSGKILTENSVSPELDKDLVVDAVMSFLGEYGQIPPMYSAIKYDGKKLYELARQGKEIERKPRQVKISSIEILDISLPRVKMKVSCSKGTYIRTLCNDIGEKLGVGACMEALLRTRVDMFSIEESLMLNEIKEQTINDTIMEKIIPIDRIFIKLLPCTVRQEAEKKIYNGGDFIKEDVVLYSPELEKSSIRVYDEKGNFIGIYGFNISKNAFTNVKMFLDI